MSTIVIQKQGHGCLAQGLWFLFIGWWATAGWISIAWILCVLLITLPIGVAMLNRVPKVLALRDPGRDGLQVKVVTADGKLVNATGQEPRPFWLRALYFVFVGWWWSAIVIIVAYALALTVIGLPVAFWLFDRVPGAVSLYR